jgi:putative addiction module antidote
MNTSLKITKVGNSAAIILPKEVLAHLECVVGDTLNMSKGTRKIELSAPDSDFEEQMAAAREVMARRKLALRELAK